MIVEQVGEFLQMEGSKGDNENKQGTNLTQASHASGRDCVNNSNKSLACASYTGFLEFTANAASAVVTPQTATASSHRADSASSVLDDSDRSCRAAQRYDLLPVWEFSYS